MKKILAVLVVAALAGCAVQPPAPVTPSKPHPVKPVPVLPAPSPEVIELTLDKYTDTELCHAYGEAKFHQDEEKFFAVIDEMTRRGKPKTLTMKQCQKVAEQAYR